jgi:hemoglobin/transferrin/lactoferrin receptor protein
LSAQEDSLLLHPERLGEKDIIIPILTNLNKQKIISGSRFPIEAGNLPFSTYVITKEEIRQNGYETLVDALKMAPGIRVSQPGNAIEGETFLMRGLLGNTYCKILINDVPIKPIFVGGMPIGAQLPVKEAERIEIIYGAGAALYGADAAAGVINIITRQSEKPVFMQADLAVGAGLYSTVNVLFGGRLGRDKTILNFFAYGNNVIMENRFIFYDRDYNYNPVNYFLLSGGDSTFATVPNYAGTPTNPVISNTPHLSRKFGFTANFRGITLSVESMYRRDHSSIGLNPVAVSYRNPQTFTGEGIWRFNLNFFKSKETRNRKTDLTYVRFRQDNRSSILHVQNHLSRELARAVEIEAFLLSPGNPDSTAKALYQNVRSRFFDGLRYLYGWSDELRFEHVRNYRILKKLSLTAGANLRVGWGLPVTHFVSRPVAESDINLKLDKLIVKNYNPSVFPVEPKPALLAEFNGFAQLFYNGRRINLVAGIQTSSITSAIDSLKTGNTEGNTMDGVSPRLAGLIKLTNRLRVRLSWGKAFRAPGNYYKAISYRINSKRLNWLGRPFLDLEPETTESIEGGLRWNIGKNILVDATWFKTETSNLLRYRREAEVFDDTLYQSFLGYLNDKRSIARYSGGQLFVRFSNLFKNNFLEGQYNLTWAKTKKLEELLIREADVLPSYDGLIHQLRLVVRPVKDYTLVLDGIKFSKIDEPGANGKRINGFFTLDAVLRYAVNERFDAYVKITNVFNKKYPGIRATGTLDDLTYNPQQGFWLRAGMNYTLE